MIEKIEHVGIQVTDLEKSVHFYTSILGMKLVKTENVPESNLQIAFVQIGESQLELLASSGTRAPAETGVIQHLAFTVSNLDGIVEQLKDADVKLVDSEPKPVFDGKARVFFFKGPDGETLELWEEQ